MNPRVVHPSLLPRRTPPVVRQVHEDRLLRQPHQLQARHHPTHEMVLQRHPVVIPQQPRSRHRRVGQIRRHRHPAVTIRPVARLLRRRLQTRLRLRRPELALVRRAEVVVQAERLRRPLVVLQLVQPERPLVRERLGGSKLKSVLFAQFTKYPSSRSTSVNVLGTSHSVDRIRWFPISVGYRPLAMQPRLGAHTGATVIPLLNRQPSDASRSICGVRAHASP